MSAYIKAISYYLPKQILSNEDINYQFPEWPTEKIAQKVGIVERHIAGDNETAGDMALRAAEKLFEEHHIDRSDIDFVILCTQSPDFFLPSTACVLQDKLQLRTDIGAFDFNLGCSGYIYGLAMAKGLIVGGIAKNVLLLTSETYTKYIHTKDKGNKTIFGDAATATLVAENGWGEIGEFVLGTDGSGAEHLIVKSGASKHPSKYDDLHWDENGNPISSDHLFMNGGEIFTFTIEKVPTLISQTLLKNNLTHSDINLFVMHQANKYILEFLRKKMNIPAEKYYLNMENVGNTVSSTIPIALAEGMDNLAKANKVLLAGFGVGLSWGATILEVHK